MKKYKMVLRAGDIPNGTIVTKVTGKAEYVLHDEIKFESYDVEYEKPQIVADNVKFLTSTNSSSNYIFAVSFEKELIAHFTEENLSRYLDEEFGPDWRY